MIGWIARDEDGELVFFDQRPYRHGGIWNALFSASSTILDQDIFGHKIEWEDEPVRVEIIIREVPNEII